MSVKKVVEEWSKKGDIYVCEQRHRFVVVHENEKPEVAITVACPFCGHSLADYSGSVKAELEKLKDSQNAKIRKKE